MAFFFYPLLFYSLTFNVMSESDEECRHVVDRMLKKLIHGLAITSEKSESIVAEDSVDLYEDIDEYFILLTDKKFIVL